jgi:hypothetical protein
MALSARAGRPRREKKADRLIGKRSSDLEVQCDFAIGPFDRLARHFEHKWGVDVLEELVPPEMAMKFGSAMAKLNAAIDSQDPEMTAARAAVCMRGLEAMDREAEKSGAQPASDDVWIIDADGVQFGLLRDARAWQRVQDKHPNIELISERVMVLAMMDYKDSSVREMIKAVEQVFPGAEMTAVKDNRGIDDEIPF